MLPVTTTWGCAARGSGRKMLGLILMEVRAALRGRGASPRATANSACRGASRYEKVAQAVWSTEFGR